MPTTKVSINPTTGSDRIELLDIFRGFALLGIYVVNIRFMSSSVLYPQAFEWMKTGEMNTITWWILQHFFNEKFFPIFSFLFGVGFGMQIQKMEEKGAFSSVFFIRRYLILFLFGLLHTIFIWPGDVLALYALAGLLLLMLRKVPPLYMVILAIIILLFPFYLPARNFFNNLLVDLGFKPMMFLYDYSYDEIVNLKTHGSFFEKVRFRIHEYSVYYRNVEYFPLLLSMIMAGYLAGKKKFYDNIPLLLYKFRYIVLAGFIIIVAVHIINFSWFAVDKPESFAGKTLLKKAMMISNILQSILYLYIIGWLYQSRILISLLKQLAFAGRMSLTNYILQSLASAFIFRGFLDLYGQYGLITLEFIALIVFTIFLIGSRLWLVNHRFGPLEWVWRELSYGKMLSFRMNKKISNININTNTTSQ